MLIAVNYTRKRTHTHTHHTQGVSEEDSVRSMSAGTDCNTSISRYESERGTYGRGTPPSIIEGQPRLDDLFRQFQVVTSFVSGM